MNLQDELNKMNPFIGKDNDAFEKQMNILFEKYTSEADQKIIVDFIAKGLEESGEKMDEFIEEVKIKLQLMEVSNIISLSYIAKNYFNKTRNWLYQKINGSTVNGKPACFTPSEIETLNYALKDIGKKIGSTVISL